MAQFNQVGYIASVPSTIPPVNLTSIGGIFGLGFGNNGLWTNTSLAAVFSLSLQPTTDQLDWYIQQTYPASLIQLGYNDSSYSYNK
jgi:hypothetical protein